MRKKIMNDMEKLRKRAIDYVRSYKGEVPQLAKETGLGYEWLKKLAIDAIPDPGILRIGALLEHSKKMGRDFSKGLDD